MWCPLYSMARVELVVLKESPEEGGGDSALNIGIFLVRR